MVFETERLFMRPWCMEDLKRLYELAKDPHVGPPCGWNPHVNIEESKSVLEDILMNDYTFAVVLKETNEIVGDISLMPYCESRFPENENQGEIGYWLGYPYWGRGYIPEACKRILQYGFEEVKLERIWCAHNIDNHNSKRVQEKCGFEFHHEDSYYERASDMRIKVMVNCMDNKIHNKN